MTNKYKKDQIINFRCEVGDRENIDFMRKLMGVSRSSFLRLLVKVEYSRFKNFHTWNKKAVDNNLFKIEKK